MLGYSIKSMGTCRSVRTVRPTEMTQPAAGIVRAEERRPQNGADPVVILLSRVASAESERTNDYYYSHFINKCTKYVLLK